MEYQLWANQMVVRFVGGDRDQLASEWDSAADLVAQIPYPIGRFLVRRHELLLPVLRDGGSYSADEFDTCLLHATSAELGPMWDQLGRGFRLPEVEWWD